MYKPISFTLNEIETERYYAFLNKHADCVRSTSCALGEVISITFTPSSIGKFVNMNCAYCKAEEDITDFNDW